MATTLALAMRASMSAGGVVSGANQAAGAMDKMGKQAQRLQKDVSFLKNLAIGKAFISSISAASRAMQGVISSAKGFADSLRQSIDETAKLAKRTGIAVESLQGFRLAAELSGVNNFEEAISKLNVKLGQASQGNKDVLATLASLGLKFDDLERMRPEDRFRAVAAAIKSLPTELQRAAAATKLFEEGGLQLLPLFAENLEKVQARAEKLGIVLSEDQTAAIESMNDSLLVVRRTLEGIAGQVLANIADVVTAISEEFLQFVEGFKALDASGGNAIASVITDSILGGIDGFLSVLQTVGHGLITFGETVSKLVDMVGNLLGITSVNPLERQRIAIEEYRAVQMDLFPETFSGSQDDLETRQQLADVVGRIENSTADALRFALDDSVRSVSGAAAAVRARLAENNTPEGKARKKALQQKRQAEEDAAREAAAAQAREALQQKRQAEEDAAREAAAAQVSQDRANRAAAAAQERQKEAAKRAEKAAAVQEKVDAKAGDIAEIEGERRKALGEKSNEALQANDVRSSQGMSQFLALATGREDPAIAEYRKQTQKLEELKAELRALQQEKVEILGAAA